MNKQRFLAELQRLLIFMTEEDREITIQRFADIFDAAGPEGEATVLGSFISPTKTAIDLSRNYQIGQVEDVLPAAPVMPEPVPEPVPEPEPEPEKAPEKKIPWTDLPDYDLPEIDALFADEPEPEGVTAAAEAEPAAVPEAEAAPEPEAEKEPEPVSEPAAETVMKEKPEPIQEPEFEREPEPEPEPEAEPEPEPRYVPKAKRRMPLVLGVILFVILFAALGIPLAVVCAVLFVAFLVPGCAAIGGAVLTAIGGLWCLDFMADAILLFGASFVVLAVGIFLLWAGLWLGIRLCGGYGKGVGALGRVLMGRTVNEDA